MQLKHLVVTTVDGNFDYDNVVSFFQRSSQLRICMLEADGNIFECDVPLADIHVYSSTSQIPNEYLSLSQVTGISESFLS